MVIIRLFPMLFWALLVSGQAYAEERLAILEFRNIDNAMSRSEVGYIAEIFRDLGAKIGRRGLSVMTKENILQLLPPGKSLEQCQGECEVETGRNIGADYVLSGEVRKLSERLGFRLTAKIHQTRDGSLLSSEIFEGKTFEQLEKDIRNSKSKDVFRPIKNRVLLSDFQEKSFGEKAGTVQGWDTSSTIVQFDTDPQGAFVEVDGTVICQQTPCSKEVGLGKHDVAFKMVQFFSLHEELNVVADMERVRRTLKPNFSLLVLKTDPDAGFEVYLDGHSIGETPLDPTRIDPRPHKLVIRNDRYYEKGIEFKVDLGVTREIFLKPDPKKGALRIIAKDSNGNDVVAEVTIGEEVTAKTPYQGTLVVDTYEISVSASAGVWHQRHEVKLNDKKQLVANLRKIVEPIRGGWQDVTTGGCNSRACRFKDVSTGLEWSHLVAEGMTWNEASAECAKLSLDGFSGWRLPTRQELMESYKHGIKRVARVDWITMDQINDDWFWSASSFPGDTSYKVIVYLVDGLDNYGDRRDGYKDKRYQVVCVR